MKGHLTERSPGHWAIVLDVRHPQTGERKRKWHSFAGTKREAQIECAKLIAELQGGTYMDPSRVTVRTFLEQWLEHIRTQVAPRTHERYQEICRKNIAPLLGAALLSKLRPQTISAAWAQALASGHRQAERGLSARTVGHMHAVLKNALGQAVRWEMLSRNPAEAVDPPRVEHRAMNTYDLLQTAKLIGALDGNRLRVAVILAVLCGLRRAEIAALRWAHVNLAAGQLAVIQSAEQTRAGVRYKPPKSGRSRTVALAGTVIEELRQHQLKQAEDLLKHGIRLTDATFICCREDGEPLKPNSITIYWARLAEKLDLPRIRFHDLRHACATHMLALGVHPKVASERLGHSKVGITLDLYSHVIPGMQEDAAERVDEALRAAMQGQRKTEMVAKR